eukprot:2517231-Rhodomonas_salina.1
MHPGTRVPVYPGYEFRSQEFLPGTVTPELEHLPGTPELHLHFRIPMIIGNLIALQRVGIPTRVRGGTRVCTPGYPGTQTLIRRNPPCASCAEMWTQFEWFEGSRTEETVTAGPLCRQYTANAGGRNSATPGRIFVTGRNSYPGIVINITESGMADTLSLVKTLANFLLEPGAEVNRQANCSNGNHRDPSKPIRPCSPLAPNTVTSLPKMVSDPNRAHSLNKTHKYND